MLRTCLAFLAVMVLVATVSRPAQAYLGGFENADGYAYAFTYVQLDNYVDVTQYNAGEWGPNAGGGAAFQQTVNSPAALWTYSSVAGAAFPNAATRIASMGAAPTWTAYPGGTVNSIPSYFVGGHFGGRLGTNALALRNASTAGDIVYDYKLDSYDFNGITPATVTSGVVGTGFFYQPNPADSQADSTGRIPPKFVMSITDSTGSVGFQWGYLRDNSVIWRQGNTGAWNGTALVGDDTNYDGVNFSVDLSSQTFSLKYYDISANTTTVLTSNSTLGNPMVDFTHIGWSLTDNVYSGVGGKNFFDDFSFATPTPEPASALMLLAAAPVALRRRRVA